MLLRNTLLVIHIAAAATWLGSNIFQIAVGRRFAAEGGAPAASWMRSTVAMGQVIYAPAGILLLVSGVWLVLRNAAIGFAATFVSIGFAVVIIGIVLGIRVFGPIGEAAEAAFAAGDDATGRDKVETLLKFGLFDTALVALAVVAMVSKWGL